MNLKKRPGPANSTRLLPGIVGKPTASHSLPQAGEGTCGAASRPVFSVFRQSLRHLLLLLVVGSAVMFTNLGAARLWDRDEPRNAGCAAEMLARGDWVIPVFNGELRDHKPVFLYWLIMSAYRALGVNEFAARFWSAALAIGSALCTYAIGRRLFHAQVGLWAGLVLLTALMFDVAGRAATPDSALIFFSTAAVAVYVLSTFARSGKPDCSSEIQLQTPGAFFPRSWYAVAALYGLMGVAVLAKGPVGLVLPTAVIGMFLLIVRLPADDREQSNSQAAGWRFWVASRVRSTLRPFAPRHFLKTCWAMRPLTAILAALVVAAPWYVLVGLETRGEFLRGFLWVHNVSRATSSMEGHNGSLLYYPAAMMVGFFPWSVFMGGIFIDAAARSGRADPWRWGYLLCLCWVGVYVGLFSLASTKLPSYVTPCYPGLALMAGAFLFRWSRGAAVAAPLWPRLSFVSLAGVGVVLAAALPLVANEYLPGEQWLGMIGIVPLLGGLVCLMLTFRQRNAHAAIAFGVTAFLFTWLLFGWGAVGLDRHQQNHKLLAAVNQFGPQAEIGAFECLEPTWIFYGGRPIQELASKPKKEEQRRANDEDWRKRPQMTPRDFFRQGDQRLVITTREKFQRQRKLFPPDVLVVAEAPYFLKKDNLILLASAKAVERTARQTALKRSTHR